MRSQFLGFSILFCFLGLSRVSAQQWVLVDEHDIQPVGQRDIIPVIYSTYAIDPDQLKQMFWSAPHEYVQNVSTSHTMVIIGLADGSADIFRIVQYDMMEAGLAAQFTQIKTFIGVSISNPYRTLRADWTLDGFRAVIRDMDGVMYIDPFQRNDLVHRIAYYRKDLDDHGPWECGVVSENLSGNPEHHERVFGDCQFRTYRLAQATTGEYSNYFGATSPAQSGLVLSQVVTAINRVNDVYEADIAVRLILINNTTAIFYYDPNGDPFSASACTQLAQNQTNTDNVIGSANYDIGHVFGVGSGGCATLGGVCLSTRKAEGATGLNPPTGDAFYIDYVAHEMGHEFGGDHTFNGTEGSCGGGNRVASSAYEPGSGTTIMAYAGICGSQDVQPHSDPYFHARSLFQIANILETTTCASFLSFNNEAPVAGNVPNYTIPISTPFVLTSIASDPENDSLSYCWEEYDLEPTSTDPPQANDTNGPMFRSFMATVSPKRYFPRLEDVTQNISPVWEVLPSVSRIMNFKVTVRDFHNQAGCTDDDDVMITTTNTAGPFLVTSQNVSTSWLEGSTQTITWNVANTNASPVNCTYVDILLSRDGGFTYPTTLAYSDANDGSAVITVPPGLTTTARVMVKGSNNIFFDINNTNITISAGVPNFTITLNPNPLSLCNLGTVQTTVEVGQFMGFSNPVTLSVMNLPPGSTAVFNPIVVNPGGTSLLTISNVSGLFGTYTPTVRGSSTTGNIDAIFSMELLSTPASAAALVSPPNNTTTALMTPILDWQPVSGIAQFEYQLAYDNQFAYMVQTGLIFADQIQITNPLIAMQQYFWRVRCVNSCGNGPWSSVFHFTTTACFSLNSTNVPIYIPADDTPTVFSVFPNPISMTITDLNIVNLKGIHTWIDDLKFSLISPQGTERLFWNQPCANHDDFNINFDDEAQNSNWPCPPTNGLTYKPDNTLTVFDGQQAKGTWTMKIQDVGYEDGGALHSWGINVCGTITCQLIVNQTSGSGLGTLPAAISCALPGDTIVISPLLGGQTINIGTSPITITKNLVILAQGANTNITVTGTRVFNLNSGIQFECNNVIITAGTSLTGGAISNDGTLKLKNTNIIRNIAINGATLIQNNPGGTLNVAGTCNINQ